MSSISPVATKPAASPGAVTIWMIGGLGNQMFQYAASKTLAMTLDAPLQICTFDYRRPGRPYLLSRLSIPEVAMDFDPFFKRAPPKLAKNAVGTRALNIGARMGLWPTLYRETRSDFDAGFFALRTPVELRGYFMSEKYFSSERSVITRCFKPSEALSQSARCLLDGIRQAETSVAVHVRGGDFLTPGAPPMLDRDYYTRAIDCIEARMGKSVAWYLFTDDHDHARRVLPQDKSFVGYNGPSDRPWEDMHLMAQCTHNIIANSSFSWWGAWLNPKPEKIVIAPKDMFLGSGVPSQVPDLYLPAWITL